MIGQAEGQSWEALRHSEIHRPISEPSDNSFTQPDTEGIPDINRVCAPGPYYAIQRTANKFSVMSVTVWTSIRPEAV
jgi:hypothetical protein